MTTKRRGFSIFLALIMALAIGTTAMAAESPATLDSLYGYTSFYHYGEYDNSGIFYVDVTGSASATGTAKFYISGFSADDAVRIVLYRPDGTVAWDSISYGGSMITMENRDKWKDQGITFPNAQVGFYRVDFAVVNFDGGWPGSGTIECWIE